MAGATVWAFREGTFGANPGSGWSHTIEFSEKAEGAQPFPEAMGGMRDAGINCLIDRLEEVGLRSRIERLAIVAHGEPGRVFMSGPTRRYSIPQQFRDLAPYLQRGGMLSFVSCDAGQGDTGSTFLIELSRQLPDRVIVGYEVKGWFEYFKSDPGMVVEAKNTSKPPPGTPLLAAWGSHAKWAHNGSIVRLPADEQKQRVNKRCANPRCPGHSSHLHRCEYKTWGQDKTLLSYNP